MGKIKLDFNDLLIVPSAITNIESRSQIAVKNHKGYLPLITAPMDTVISEKNELEFLTLGIRVCQPRYENSKIKDSFISFSLSEFKNAIKFNELSEFGYYLIDTANGHLQSMIDTIHDCKNKYTNITLMVGNIANAKSYGILSDAGADYIRVGIGNGGGCLTTQNTGVGYPIASLIQECHVESLTLFRPAKIVADGGMQTYSDVIKALACGADYVMLGNIFNKALESAGDNYLWKWMKVSQSVANWVYKAKFIGMKIPVYKKFRGMSTKEVQKKWGAKQLKTSEGVVRFRKVEYTLKQWVNNFDSYLRSAMSYTNAKTLEEFIGRPKIIQISTNAYRRFNK